MVVAVQLFASLREAAGRTTVELSLPEGATVRELRLALQEQLQSVSGLVARCAVAVNEEYARDDVELANGDVVAAIPPVSGGRCV